TATRRASRPGRAAPRAAQSRPTSGINDRKPTSDQCDSTGLPHATTRNASSGVTAWRSRNRSAGVVAPKRRRPRARATTRNAQTQGNRYSAWPTTNHANASGRNARPSTARPPWKANEAHPCAAFHATTGEKAARPTANARYGPGRRSQGRAEGSRTTYSNVPAGRKTAWYLLSNAPPHARPTATQGHVRPGDCKATARRSSVNNQKNTSGPSGSAN